jgi:hypothetical protein
LVEICWKKNLFTGYCQSGYEYVFEALTQRAKDSSTDFKAKNHFSSILVQTQ